MHAMYVQGQLSLFLNCRYVQVSIKRFLKEIQLMQGWLNTQADKVHKQGMPHNDNVPLLLMQGWLLNNVAVHVLWSAYHCVAFLVCVLCQPVHSLIHLYISQISFRSLVSVICIKIVAHYQSRPHTRDLLLQHDQNGVSCVAWQHIAQFEMMISWTLNVDCIQFRFKLSTK